MQEEEVSSHTAREVIESLQTSKYQQQFWFVAYPWGLLTLTDCWLCAAVVPALDEPVSGCESMSRVLISLYRSTKRQCANFGRSKVIGPHLASVKNASSTPSFTFALVSMNLMPSSCASSRPCSSLMTFLSTQSHLFPTRILFTPSEACCSMFECQVRTSAEMGQSKKSNGRRDNSLLKDRSSVTS